LERAAGRRKRRERFVSLKTQIKSVLSPMVRAAWPVVETIGDLEARAKRGALELRWSNEWTPEFDQALDTLPALPDCRHDLYRELAKPTRATKRHALVLEEGKPSALISLRQCARHWEPVTYQCLPSRIAPASNAAALGRALNALGLDVRVPAGLWNDVNKLGPSQSWAYDFYAIELQGDYEAYWAARKRQSRIRRALRDNQHLQHRVDEPGDLAWTVEQWREQWKDDPGQEIVAADDRLNFWSALAERNDSVWSVHTLALADGARRAAGLVLLCKGDEVWHQCISRDPSFSDAGTAINLFAVDWAKANGYRLLDLGGGAYKRDWGPVGGQRYGAVFRPRVMSALSWAS
jgi:hypothetical protein